MMTLNKVFAQKHGLTMLIQVYIMICLCYRYMITMSYSLWSLPLPIRIMVYYALQSSDLEIS
jgi:hypothetical protein